MSKSISFYFHVGLAISGAWLSFFLIKNIYLMIKERSIPRRNGLQPFSPREGASIYWTLLLCTILGTIGIAFSTVSWFFDLMNL